MFGLLRDRNFVRILLIILLIVFLYPLGSSRIKTLHNSRLKTQDIFFNIRYNLKKPIPGLKDIIIVSIDDESFKALNRRWPWTRDLFAVLVKKLTKFSAGLICIDLAFVGESTDPAVDELLGRSMQEAANVIVASHFGKEGNYILPDKTIRKSVLGFGFVNKPRDTDYAVRRTRPLIFSVKGNVIDYSFALKIAARYLGFGLKNIIYEPIQQSIILKSEKTDKEYRIKLREGGIIDLNYSAKPELFTTIPFWRVVTEKVDPATFKDKIVLVGTTAEVFHDIYQTPFGLMAGVLVNANEVLMYTTKNFIRRVSDLINFFVHLLLGIAVLVITYRFGLLKGLLTIIILLFLTFSTNLYLLFQNYKGDFFGIFFIVVGTYLITYGYKNIGLLIDNMILRKEATTDGLTGLYVYRYFELKLRNEFKRAGELKNPLALIILDIDHFKKMNDTYGHEEGNLILKELARIMMKFSRRTDTVCRYGGEEFCVIMEDTDSESALKYAENMRKTIAAHDFVITKGVLKVTASLGIATTQKEDIRSPDELIKRADAALYQAKEAGRNRVVLSNSHL